MKFIIFLMFTNMFTIVPKEVMQNRGFLLMCRMITIFLVTQRARLSGPFRYLQHVRKVNRKFSRGSLKKSVSPKSGVLSEYSNPILSFIFFKISTFLIFPD